MKQYYVVYASNKVSRPYDSMERAVASHHNWENGVSILTIEGNDVQLVAIPDAATHDGCAELAKMLLMTEAEFEAAIRTTRTAELMTTNSGVRDERFEQAAKKAEAVCRAREIDPRARVLTRKQIQEAYFKSAVGCGANADRLTLLLEYLFDEETE
jgi:hypothetical protein